MTDPKYLIDEGSEASDFERELLQAAQGVRLSTSEKEAIWAGIAVQAAPWIAATPSVAPAAVAKAALGLTPLVKGALLVVSLGGLSVAGYCLNREPVSAAATAMSASESAPAPQQAASAPDAPAAPSRVASAAESAAPPSTSANLPTVSRELGPKQTKSALSDESAAVLEVRRTLRAGEASHALRLLEQARQRFPKGALSQEREALTIEALAKSGARAAAARKANSFLHAYPKSPYASDVQSFATE